MKLHVNEIGGDIRYEELNGDEHIVAPIRLIKSMRLHRGYVPQEHVANSKPAWNGTPLTLNHPRNAEGDLVSANSPETIENTQLGQIFNAEVVDGGQFLDGEAWVNADRAQSLGGEAERIANELEDGNTISVSSSYFGNDLPPGEYDGEHRDNVKGNLKPDHVAVLPNKEGKCTIDDGCGVGVQVANSELCVEMSDDSVSPESGQDEASIKETLEDADEEELEAVANSSVGERIKAFFGFDTMNDKHEFLVNERGYDEENLPPEGSDCLDKLHSNEKKLYEMEEDEQSGNEQGPDHEQDDDGADEAVMNQLEEIQDSMVTSDELDEAVEEKIAANEVRSEKKQLADTIISNSDDHTEDDMDELLDSPKSVLETLASNVEEDEGGYGADRRGQLGASPSANDDETDSWPSPVANERAAEMED